VGAAARDRAISAANRKRTRPIDPRGSVSTPATGPAIGQMKDRPADARSVCRRARPRGASRGRPSIRAVESPARMPWDGSRSAAPRGATPQARTTPLSGSRTRTNPAEHERPHRHHPLSAGRALCRRTQYVRFPGPVRPRTTTLGRRLRPIFPFCSLAEIRARDRVGVGATPSPPRGPMLARRDDRSGDFGYRPGAGHQGGVA
jgi:hypothetical protein